MLYCSWSLPCSVLYLFSHSGITPRFPGLYLYEVQCETIDGDAWVGQLRWVGSVVASENVVWIDGSEVQDQLQLHTGNGWGNREQL